MKIISSFLPLFQLNIGGNNTCMYYIITTFCNILTYTTTLNYLGRAGKNPLVLYEEGKWDT